MLVGGHKAGKSTLLHCLAGIEPVSSGDALVCGASVRYGYLHRRNRIGFCPQYEVLLLQFLHILSLMIKILKNRLMLTSCKVDVFRRFVAFSIVDKIRFRDSNLEQLFSSSVMHSLLTGSNLGS